MLRIQGARSRTTDIFNTTPLRCRVSMGCCVGSDWRISARMMDVISVSKGRRIG
jgi:hypothetical protein